MKPSDLTYRRALRRLLEWGVALTYIGNQEPLRCAVCGGEISTLREFKKARSGHEPDWVHAQCWEAYVWHE